MTTVKSATHILARRTLLAGAIAAIGLGATTGAAPAQGLALVDLRVVDRETGEEAQVWRHDGRMFVAGRPGARYGIRVRNRSAGRVLVVLSVDGVNVLSGETASYDQKGYILRPYVSADVNGWRKSDTEVAAFTFAPLSRSYAARTGRPNDVGVIGMAVFTERERTPVVVGEVLREESRADAAVGARVSAMPAPPPVTVQSAPAARAAAAPERLGTGHGQREWSAVATVAFERSSSRPRQVAQLEYDSWDNLVARGVIPPARPTPRGPRPFPGEGYVPDPPRGR